MRRLLPGRTTSTGTSANQPTWCVASWTCTRSMAALWWRMARPSPIFITSSRKTRVWWAICDRDFSKSADLVRRFVDLHALNGSALVEDGETVAYLYYVLEENKGLVGDLRSELQQLSRPGASLRGPARAQWQRAGGGWRDRRLSLLRPRGKQGSGGRF